MRLLSSLRTLKRTERGACVLVLGFSTFSTSTFSKSLNGLLSQNSRNVPSNTSLNRHGVTKSYMTSLSPTHCLIQDRHFSGRVEKLAGEKREKYLSRIGAKGWKVQNDRDAIEKTYEFLDFSQAWSFMARVGLLAEKMDHHPEWFNVYNRVEVTLATHDCGGISKNDIEMAEAMDKYANNLVS
jgi:4a-hydroxytetrahydrobiopterin dehydratase